MAVSKTLKDIADKARFFTNMDDKANDFPIYINGQQLPPANSFKVSLEDLYEKSWRDEQGIQHGERIRQDVRKLSFTWTGLTKEDASFILNLVRNQYIDVSYPDDPLTGGRHTIHCYTGAKECTLRGWYKGYTWWDTISFNVIEQ